MPVSPCSYKERTRNELRRGVVVGFPTLSSSALLRMKSELGLSMTVPELQLCRKAYKNAPPITLDEVFFLDGIARGKHRSLEALSVMRFLFNDPVIMETYRDLIDKAELLSGLSDKNPPALHALLDILSETLARSGRCFGTGTDIPVFDPDSALALAASGYRCVEAVSVAADVPTLSLFTETEHSRPLWSAKAAENDVILLISREGEDFLERVARFAKTELYCGAVRAVRPITAEGLAIALTSLSSGVYTELHRVPSVFDEGELYDLAYAEIGGLLVSVPFAMATAFAEEAERQGLSAAQIARAVRGGILTVRREGRAPFGIRSSLLHSLSELHIPFAVNDASPSESAQLCEGKAPALSVLQRNDRVYAVAGVETQSFRDGLYTALTAVLSAVLCGADPSTLSAVEAYTAPAVIDSETVGTLFTAALGAYRVFAELAVPNRVTLLPSDGKTSAVETVACTGTSESPHRTARHFVGRDSELCLVFLSDTDAGIPAFSAVRSVIRLLGTLQKEGHILSAGVGYNESPATVIDRMRIDGITLCGVSEELSEQLSEKVCGLFVLLETDVALDGLGSFGRLKRTAMEPFSENSAQNAADGD